MKRIIDVPDDLYNRCCRFAEFGVVDRVEKCIANSIPYEERPQCELANEVWKLYEKYHPYLATSVIEFGDELKDLLGKYQKGGEEE